MVEPFLFVLGPRHCPFDAAAFRKFNAPNKRTRCQHCVAIEACRQEIAKPTREMKPRLSRDSFGSRKRRIATPANLQAAEQIGFRARHAIERRRAEPEFAENRRIRVKAYGRAAAILHRTAV